MLLKYLSCKLSSWLKVVLILKFIHVIGCWSAIGFLDGEASATYVYDTSCSQGAVQEKHVLCTEGNVSTSVIQSFSTDPSCRVPTTKTLNNQPISKWAYDFHYWQPADDSERKRGKAETFPETPPWCIYTAVSQWAAMNIFKLLSWSKFWRGLWPSVL